MCRMIPFASASVGECLIIQGIYRTRASDIFKSNRMPLLTFHAARVEIQLTDALVFFLFSFFFHARPPAFSPRSLPALCPRLSFSRIRRRITCYADTSHYYSQGRTGRRTDICKSHVMQYASVRESEIDAHNQSAIDRFTLTTWGNSLPFNRTLNNSEFSIRIIFGRRIFNEGYNRRSEKLKIDYNKCSESNFGNKIIAFRTRSEI